MLTKASAEERKCYFCLGTIIADRAVMKNIRNAFYARKRAFCKILHVQHRKQAKQLNSVASVTTKLNSFYCCCILLFRSRGSRCCSSSTPVSALVDIGAFESYINKHFAKEMKFAIKRPC